MTGSFGQNRRGPVAQPAAVPAGAREWIWDAWTTWSSTLPSAGWPALNVGTPFPAWWFSWFRGRVGWFLRPGVWVSDVRDVAGRTCSGQRFVGLGSLGWCPAVLVHNQPTRSATPTEACPPTPVITPVSRKESVCLLWIVGPTVGAGVVQIHEPGYSADRKQRHCLSAQCRTPRSPALAAASRFAVRWVNPGRSVTWGAWMRALATTDSGGVLLRAGPWTWGACFLARWVGMCPG